MANSPATVRWLDAEEKQVLQQAIDREQGDDEDADLHGWKATVVILRNPEVWFYSGVYLLMMLGFYSVTYWLPQIIQQKMDTGSVESGLLSAIPWAVATGALFLVSWYTSRHGRRAQMLTAILIVCTAGMLVGSLVGNPEIALVGLCFGACIQAAVPLLYSFPSQHFPGAKGAVALALVNTIGNIGGFAGPYLLGWLREATGTDKAGLLILASSFALAAILSTQLPRALRRSPTYAPVVD
jgi:cyanate permease